MKKEIWMKGKGGLVVLRECHSVDELIIRCNDDGVITKDVWPWKGKKNLRLKQFLQPKLGINNFLFYRYHFVPDRHSIEQIIVGDDKTQEFSLKDLQKRMFSQIKYLQDNMGK